MVLILGRRESESIILDKNITLTVREIKEDGLGIVLGVPYGTKVNVISNAKQAEFDKVASYLTDEFAKEVGFVLLPYYLEYNNVLNIESVDGKINSISFSRNKEYWKQVKIFFEADDSLEILREELCRGRLGYAIPPERNMIGLESGFIGYNGLKILEEYPRKCKLK